MPRVLLLLPTNTYRTQDFVNAAHKLGVDVTVGSEKPSTFSSMNSSAFLLLDFNHPTQVAEKVALFSRQHPLQAVVPVDSQVVATAAAIGERLGLRHNQIDSIAAAQNKYYMRQRFERAGVPSPPSQLCSFGTDHAALAKQVCYPCVVKPLTRSASQGVIRADNASEFRQAVDRLANILTESNLDHGQRDNSQETTRQPRQFLVERFVAGPEVALEAILTRSQLKILAMFDKPDPLNGPFFEETIYVTPSRHTAKNQRLLTECLQQAVRALELTEGPIHAELRLGSDGPVVIEVQARSIGGLCSRILRFGTGMSLEELIIRNALDDEFEPPSREARPAGVMMIPTPREGRFERVCGLEEAKAICGIEAITISAHPGQHLVRLPEGSLYLGFIFARADSAAATENALRLSHAQLQFIIDPVKKRTGKQDGQRSVARKSTEGI